MKKILAVLLFIFTLSFILCDGFFLFNDHKLDIIPHQGPYKGTSVYLINLEISKKRLNSILPLVKALDLPFHRVVAIFGADLTSQEIQELVDLKAYKNFLGHYPRRGMIGCNLSHRKAWGEFLESDNEFALFLEDDVSFDPKLLKKVISELENNNNLWDLTSFEISHKGTPLTLKQLPQTDRKLVVYLTEVTHAGAYLLNRKAALSLYSKAIPIKMPIDHYFTRPWEFDIIMAGIEPRLVFQTFGDSEIGKTTNVNKEQEEEDVSISALIHKATYKLKSYMIRVVYTLWQFSHSIYLDL